MVAIQGNDPKAIRIDELDSSDVSDTLDDMKVRVAYKHLRYPYLYAGDDTRSPARMGRKQRRTSSSSIRLVGFDMKVTSTIAIASNRSRLMKLRTPSMRCWPVKTSRSRIRGSSVALPNGRRNRCRKKQQTASSTPQPVHLEQVDAAGLTKSRADPEAKSLSSASGQPGVDRVSRIFRPSGHIPHV